MTEEKGRKKILGLPRGRFGQKLTLMFLLVSLLPIIGFAAWSLRDLRQVSLRSAESELERIIKMIALACEAQEALDRIRETSVAQVDTQTGASPAWQEGDRFLTLRELIRSIQVGDTGYAYVLDSKGVFQVHPQLERMNLFKLDTGISELLKIRDRTGGMQPGAVKTLRYPWPDEHGTPRGKIAKFGYFKPYDWIIVVAVFEDEILAPFYADLWFLVIFLLVTVFAVAVFALIVSRYLMRPIKQLTGATTAIAEGDFSVELPTASDDEIGQMAKSFRLMVQRVSEARESLLEWSRTLEQKVLERTEELEKAHESVLISEKMASLGKLSAMVAHELNNPLSGVLSYLKLTMKLLGREETPPTQGEKIHQYLDLSAGEVKRCGEIVKNLLMFSKSSFGEFRWESVSAIIDKSIALIKHTADMKSVALTKEIVRHGDDKIYCDASGLQQMLVALIVNALDAMPKGGKLTIEVDFDAKAAVTMRVVDTGKGIPEHVLPRIFEPFFSAKDTKKNIGMGLSVVYGIVKSHDGDIVVRSRVGEGTTFVITLPRSGPTEKFEIGGPDAVPSGLVAPEEAISPPTSNEGAEE